MLELDIVIQRGDFVLPIQAQLNSTVTGIFGASGCGKSSLLSAIAGLLRPQQGQIILDGQVLFDSRKKINLAPQQRHIGLMFQDGQLFPHLSVNDNLLYGYQRLSSSERHFHLTEICQLLEISHLLSRLPRQLSGGEKQRVALGRAILYSPRLLLLDEPLSSLDETRKSQILPFLARVRDEVKIPMLYVSHALSEIDYLTKDIIYLHSQTKD
ncbi:MAG: molybdenum ABC transporter ATP-binding protein [Agitococcus sp.]